MPVLDAKILILCKTYPSPSSKYAELSCVAGMDEHGSLIRLFPVPFRLIAENQQFKKWQWIEAKISKATKDHRPESYTVKVDTLKTGIELPINRDWAERRLYINKLKLFTDFDQITNEQVKSKISLALLKPSRIITLEIIPVNKPDWTKAELDKLEQAQQQAGLFDQDDMPSLKTLQKLPYDFYYIYECQTSNGTVTYKHKITDWEVGALFRNCQRNHGINWEVPFREQIEKRLPDKDLMFLVGNMHRFQEQWLIISLIYPPHEIQKSLF